jgi:biotin transporter BioY
MPVRISDPEVSGEKGWGESFAKCLVGMVIGTLVITTFGVLFLSTRYGLADALKYGFYPFIWGAAIKTLVGATIPPIYHNLIKDKDKKINESC